MPLLDNSGRSILEGPFEATSPIFLFVCFVFFLLFFTT